MGTKLLSWLWRPKVLRTLISHGRLASRLIREPRVPLLTKALPLLAVLYVLSPLDFIPDVFPVVGEIDDLTVLLFAVALFLKLCPAGAVAFHRDALGERRPFSPMSAMDDIIDAQWRHS
jgi:uncharacterized membrane protein YkvA (DUF1232 family)